MRLTEQRLLPAALAILVAGVLAACSTDQPVAPAVDAESPTRYEDWVPLQPVGALEAEPYRPIAELGETADVVAIGRFSGFLDPRAVGQRPALAWELPVLFEPTQVFRGTVDAPLPVEFPIIGPSDSIVGDATAAYRKVLIGPEFLLILRAKRWVGEEGRYRIVNTYGLWVRTDRHAVDAPMAEFDPWGRAEYSATLAGIGGTLQELASVAVSLPQKPAPPLPGASPTAG